MTARYDPWNYAAGLFPPTKKPRAHPEEDLQRAIVQHLLIRGAPDVLWWHCPSGEMRSKRTAAKLKAMGVRRGVPDLNFLLADGTPAYIELKCGKNGLSDDQKAFQARCVAMGVPYEVCYTLDKALSILSAWGVLK